MKLIIRADATPEIGTGHVMRCIALAQAAVQRNMPTSFITSCSVPFIKNRLQELGGPIEYLSDSSSSEDDIEQVRRAIDFDSQNAIILDGYHFDCSYQNSLCSENTTVVLMDDYAHNSTYSCDVLINPSTIPELSPYQLMPKTKLLIGHKYVMLRTEFLQNPPQATSAEPLHLLISMGGADPANATVRILQDLKTQPLPSVHITVLAGPANPHLEEIALHLAQIPCASSTLVAAVKDMPSFLKQMDLAITAAGSTCFELARMGVFALTLVTAENQSLLHASLLKSNMAVSLGRLEELPPEWTDTLLRCIKDKPLRESVTQHAATVIDGLGANRILEILDPTPLRLRKAIPSDYETIWYIANDPHVRAASFSSSAITLETHRKWFTKVLANDSMAFYIAENSYGASVGYVRFATGNTVAQPPSQATISVAMAQAFRGCGLGVRLIQDATQKALLEYNFSSVLALIKADNIASVKSFEAAGFIFSATGEHAGYTTVSYIFGGTPNAA